MTDANGRFAGKIAVVTGAAQGIGFATAQRLARLIHEAAAPGPFGGDLTLAA